VSDWPEDEWPEDSMPAQTQYPASTQAPGPPIQEPAERPAHARTNTSAFFNARAQAAVPPTNGAHPPAAAPPPPPTPEHVKPEQPGAASPTAGSDDAIFQKMLSEWLIDDPTELAQSTDLDWKTVWDSGWEAAAAAEQAPVAQHTEHGLPMREPGARLVPGAAEGQDDDHNGRHRNGGTNGTNGVQERGDAVPHALPSRDPEAVRASIGNHFGGVHAGRTHARENRGTEEE
jgi:hypothetical protein